MVVSIADVWVARSIAGAIFGWGLAMSLRRRAVGSKAVRSAEQLAFAFPFGHGGARRNAGRKRLPAGLRHTPHRTRGRHAAAWPMHVTLRAGVRCLRSQVVARVVLGALRASNRQWFRIVHYSVQENHVHLLVEAETAAALSSAMHGLMVRVARRVNRVLSRRGRFWADRWHGRALSSPREVRNALIYVIRNRAKHAGATGSHVAQAPGARAALPPAAARAGPLDALSSAGTFDGFAQELPAHFRPLGPCCVMPARSWLLRSGWRRHGAIDLSEVPRA